DGFAGQHAPDGVVVVLDLEGPEARLADVQGGDWGFGAALAASEPFCVAHLATLLCALLGAMVFWCTLPQLGQSGRRVTAMRRQLPVRVSIASSRSANDGAAPVSRWIASAACTLPARTTAGPRPPAPLP